MSWLDTLRSGFEAIATVARFDLTVLGILIGIAAVILTVGLGEGATASVNSAINSLGTNLLIVTPGSTTTGLVRGGSVRSLFMEQAVLKNLLDAYTHVGYSYVNYPHADDYGISMSTASHIISQVEKYSDLRLLHYKEQGWDNHTRRYACSKR